MVESRGAEMEEVPEERSNKKGAVSKDFPVLCVRACERSDVKLLCQCAPHILPEQDAVQTR